MCEAQVNDYALQFIVYWKIIALNLDLTPCSDN